MKLAGVILNRKVLSQLAIDDPKAFDQLAELAGKSVRRPAAKAAA